MYTTIITHIRLQCSGHWQMVVIHLRKMLLSGFVPCITDQTTTLREYLTGQCCFHYICISITEQHQYLMFFVFNSALKGLDDTPQPKSKAGARWIVVKVRDLNKTSTYIYCLCVCTLIVVNV